MSKSVWGPATWSMLHCLVLKLKDETPKETIEYVKDIILSICYNLPCPYCAAHARSVIEKSDYTRINDLLTLKVFIFNFHNKVNEKLKKQNMDYSSHLEKYKNVKLIDVVNTFIKVFNNNNGTTMMLYSFHKSQVTQKIKKYFRENAQLYILN